MKKIIILLLFIFISTGCYDYKELNNLAIIVGIAIDYNEENNNYELTYEILNEQKDSNEKTYYVTGSGKSITDAINKAELEINKIPYYTHLKVLILNKNLFNKKTINFYEYFLRNPNITTTYSIILANNSSAKDIINFKKNNTDIVSEKIANLIHNKNTSNKLISNISFENFIDMITSNKKNLYLPSISIDNGINESNFFIFDNNYNTHELTYDESKLLNNLLNSKNKTTYKIECQKNRYTSIEIYKTNTDYNITKNKLNINVNTMASILENECNYDLKNKQTYINLQDEFNKLLNTKYKALIIKLQNNNSDALGINEIYYKNHKDKINFSNLKINVDTNISINKNGLIFEVNK